jgi:hypothetical protein
MDQKEKWLNNSGSESFEYANEHLGFMKDGEPLE